MPGGVEVATAAAPRVLVNGVEQPSIAASVTRFDVYERIGEPTQLELELVDWGNRPDGTVGFLWSDRAVMDFGARVELAVGDEDLFAGKIADFEAHFAQGSPPDWVVQAADVLWELDGGESTRHFENMNDVEAAEHVANEHGLAIETSVPAAPVHASLPQVACSDLAFLVQRAERLGADLLVRDGGLLLRDRNVHTTAIELVAGENLIGFSCETHLAEQATSVDVVGWDRQTKQEIRSTASAGAPGSSADARAGAHELSAGFGLRSRVRTDVEPTSAEDASMLARVDLTARSRRFKTGRGVALGDARIRAGERVSILGVAPLFAGDYRVVAARHTFDSVEGWRVRFEVERADTGLVGKGSKVPPSKRPPADDHGGKGGSGKDPSGKGAPCTPDDLRDKLSSKEERE